MKTFIPQKLQSLNSDDLRELNQWLDDHPYKRVRVLVFEHFAITVSDATLCRYVQNRDLARCVSERDDDQAAIEEFSKLVNGQPIAYDAAGLELIMKRAFDAVSHPDCSVNKLAILQRVFHYKTNLALTQQREQRHGIDSAHRREFAAKRHQLAERNTQIREETLDLRRAELEQKNARRNPIDPQEDELGPYAETCEDVETRAFRQFGVPESEWPARRAASKKAREAVRAARNASPQEDPVFPASNENFILNP